MDSVASLGLPLGMACQHILPVLLSKLTERKAVDWPTVESVVSTGKQLLSREVDALKFVEERDVPQVAIFAAADDVASPLHLRVVEAPVKSYHVRRLCVPTTLSQKSRLELPFLEKPHLN